MNLYFLENREVISISGEDRFDFLQSLVSNDVNKIRDGSILYGLFLNPQGRFMYDVFMFEEEDRILCDIQKSRKQELLNKLKMYKMRKDIQILSLEGKKVFVSFEESDTLKATIFKDPRNTNLGYRVYSEDFNSISNDLTKYHEKRISLLIPDADIDLDYMKTLPMDLEMHRINAIDFEKGCYVGQEVTARMNYRGKLRKTIKSFKAAKDGVEKGEEILFDGKKIGTALGIVGSFGLGLMYKEGLEKVASLKELKLLSRNTEIEITIND